MSLNTMSARSVDNGSDVFAPTDDGFTFMTERAASALRRKKISNMDLESRTSGLATCSLVGSIYRESHGRASRPRT